MRKKDSLRIQTYGVHKELDDADGRDRDAASIERSDRDQTLFSIEQRDDQLFPVEMREMRRERRGRELRRIAALAVRTGDDHAPTQLARRGETRRGRGPETALAETRDV